MSSGRPGRSTFLLVQWWTDHANTNDRIKCKTPWQFGTRYATHNGSNKHQLWVVHHCDNRPNPYLSFQSRFYFWTRTICSNGKFQRLISRIFFRYFCFLPSRELGTMLIYLNIIGLWRRAWRYQSRTWLLQAAVCTAGAEGWQIEGARDLHPVSKNFRTNCLWLRKVIWELTWFPCLPHHLHLLISALYCFWLCLSKHHHRHGYSNASSGYGCGRR